MFVFFCFKVVCFVRCQKGGLFDALGFLLHETNWRRGCFLAVVL